MCAFITSSPLEGCLKMLNSHRSHVPTVCIWSGLPNVCKVLAKDFRPQLVLASTEHFRNIFDGHGVASPAGTSHDSNPKKETLDGRNKKKKTVAQHLPVQTGILLLDALDAQGRWVGVVVEVRLRFEHRLVRPVDRLLKALAPRIEAGKVNRKEKTHEIEHIADNSVRRETKSEFPAAIALE